MRVCLFHLHVVLLIIRHRHEYDFIMRGKHGTEHVHLHVHNGRSQHKAFEHIRGFNGIRAGLQPLHIHRHEPVRQHHFTCFMPMGTHHTDRRVSIRMRRWRIHKGNGKNQQKEENANRVTSQKIRLMCLSGKVSYPRSESCHRNYRLLKAYYPVKMLAGNRLFQESQSWQ